MPDEQTQPRPVLQRLYDRIWLLALASLVFFYVTYLAWGLSDLAATPTW